MKKKDIYIQDDISSCGARCVQSIVSFYNGYVPLEMALEDTNTTKSGTTAFDLVQAFKKYGFDAYGIKVNIDKMDKNRLPVVAHTIKDGYEHFLVIYEITDKGVLTMDPECGKKLYNLTEFKSIFTNAVIIVTPIGSLPKFKKSKSLLKTFIPILKELKLKILIVVVLSIILVIFNLLIGFHLKILNEFSFDPIKITALFIILRLIISLITLSKDVCLEKMIKHIDSVSLNKFTTHIFKLPIRYLNNKRVGEIVKKIEDMTFIKDLLIRITVINTLDCLSLLITYPILIMLSGRLTLIYSITLILYTIITILTQKTIYKNEKNYLKTYNEYSGTLIEYLDGLESIKNLNVSDIFLNDIESHLNTHINTRSKGNITNTSLTLSKNSVFEIGTLFINLIGFLSLSPNFTFIDLITYESIFSLFYVSFESIIETFELFLKGKAIFLNICEFNDISEERSIPVYNEPFQNIMIKDFSYTYDQLHYTIKDFNYSLRRGDKLLISGPSGIGKSTLVKCLSGHLDNYEGSICLNERDIKSIGVDSLRNHIVYIGQEECLFRKSILENVTLDNPNIESFAKIANLTLLDEVIEKRTDKENTTLLEGASNLSGGEKARVILARALYRSPSVLIIDETLSSISEEMENTILKNLLEIEDLSLIYITHRNKENMFKKILKFRKDGTYDIN